MSALGAFASPTIVSLLALLSAVAGQAPTPLPPVCNIPTVRKIDCMIGNQPQCVAASCCWFPVQPNPNNVPWCYQNASTPGPSACLLHAATATKPFSAALPLLRSGLLQNVDIGGLGGVVASPDRNVPGGGSYFYAWMRDGGLSMRTILRTWPNATASQRAFVAAKMDGFVHWVVRAQNQPDPHGIDVRVEPKFNLPNADVYTGGWCRPQTDGPAIRGTTLALFAEQLLASGNSSYVTKFLWTGDDTVLNGGLVAYDLDWVAANWDQVSGCDLWEEVSSNSFFWNLVHQKLAMSIGGALARKMGDTKRAATYGNASTALDAALMSHWNGQYFIEATNRQIDSAVTGAFKNAFELRHPAVRMPWGDPSSPAIAQTVATWINVYCSQYVINQALVKQPGFLIGRYPNDHYGGGGPWVLATAQLAAVFFEVAHTLRQNGVVSSATLTTWNSILDASLQATDANSLAASLESAGNGILQRLETLVAPYSYQLSEQLDRVTGVELSATNLTWSYASVLDAVHARDT